MESWSDGRSRMQIELYLQLHWHLAVADLTLVLIVTKIPKRTILKKMSKLKYLPFRLRLVEITESMIIINHVAHNQPL